MDNNIYKYSATITRPANNTPYALGDVVTDTDEEVTLVVPDGVFAQGGEIIGARVDFDHNDTTDGTFRLFLFDSNDNQATIADNAPHTMSFAAAADCIGWVDLTLSASGIGSTSVVGTLDGVTDFIMPFKIGNEGIYARLTATDTYIPKFGGSVQITLMVRG